MRLLSAIVLASLPAVGLAQSTPQPVLVLNDATLGKATSELTLGHDIDWRVFGQPFDLTVVIASPTPPVPGLLFMGMPIEFDLANSFTLGVSFATASGVGGVSGSVPPSMATGATVWVQAATVEQTTLAIRLTGGLAPMTASEPFETVEQSTHSAHPLAQGPGVAHVLVDNQADWDLFWMMHTAFAFPQAPQPPVDFTQDAVVALFAGQKTTGGYTIEIDRMLYLTSALQIEGTETRPGPGCPVDFALTAPYHIVKVARQVAAPLQANVNILTVSCP